jgi:DNA-binding LytR/AlgR family response regulator
MLTDVEEVCHFRANDQCMRMFASAWESLVRTPLRKLVDQPDSRQFWQVRRGTVVNVREASATTRDLTGRTRLGLERRPQSLQVTRARAHLVRQR